MEINYNPGNNGKMTQRDEVIPMSMDIHEMKESDIAKDVLRYIAKKAGFREARPREKKEEEGASEIPKGRRSAAAERRAFMSLSKRPEAKTPEGTVGATVPMEIRIKQLSLFPGIY